jgi:hypothetical protein
MAHQVVLRHGPANEIERSFKCVAAALARRQTKWAPEALPIERLPDDVLATYADQCRILEIRPARTAWRSAVRLCAKPEGDPVRREGRRIYRIRIWLESERGLRHVTWVDYDLHPEYGAVRRRAMRISEAQGNGHFRHWVNTWDDFWVRVRCSDGSEFGEWLSKSIEDTAGGNDSLAKECVADLTREAHSLRRDGYQERAWCDYVDLPPAERR